MQKTMAEAEVLLEPVFDFIRKCGAQVRLFEERFEYTRALCANMDETLPPSEFRVEGGEGTRDEYPA
jgi:hypothetical protein